MIDMENKNLKKQIAIGTILIIIGITFFMKDFVADRREKVFSAMNLELTELLALDNSTPDQPVEQVPEEQHRNQKDAVPVQ